MFSKYRMGRRVAECYYISSNLYKHCERQIHEEADCNEDIWCTFVIGHTTVTIRVIYCCPNIPKQNNENIHNAISEVSKGDSIIMVYFNHVNNKWTILQNTGVEDQSFLCLVLDNFLTQHIL